MRRTGAANGYFSRLSGLRWLGLYIVGSFRGLGGRKVLTALYDILQSLDKWGSRYLRL